jgi:hypothetical protein
VILHGGRVLRVDGEGHPGRIAQGPMRVTAIVRTGLP